MVKYMFEFSNKDTGTTSMNKQSPLMSVLLTLNRDLIIAKAFDLSSINYTRNRHRHHRRRSCDRILCLVRIILFFTL